MPNMALYNMAVIQQRPQVRCGVLGEQKKIAMCVHIEAPNLSSSSGYSVVCRNA